MNSKNLKSIICGRELKIQQILEKWKVGGKDIDIILDEIAKIEADTIELVIIIESEKKYFAAHPKLRKKGSKPCKENN